MIRPYGGPKERQERVKPIKDPVGILAACETSTGNICIIKWCRDRLRIKEKQTWKPRPLSPYWNDLYKEMFKNW